MKIAFIGLIVVAVAAGTMASAAPDDEDPIFARHLKAACTSKKAGDAVTVDGRELKCPEPGDSAKK